MALPQLGTDGLAPKVRRVELFTEEDGREVVVLRTGRWRHVGVPVEDLDDVGLRSRLAALAVSLAPEQVDQRIRRWLVGER